MTDKRVPREPTQAMIDAAIGIDLLETGWNRGMAILWQQMYDAAPAAPDEREPLGEPDAWLVTDPINPSQVFSERPEPSEIPGGCLVALYSEERINALRRERDALKAALRTKVIGRSINYFERRGCSLCKGEWHRYDAEHHAPGCLAAPEDAP